MAFKSSRTKNLIISAVALVAIAIALGVGLGVGLKKPDGSSSSSLTSSSSSSSNISTATSNATLAFISKSDLVQAHNFAPGVGWNSSEPPRTREFSWDVEEVWGSPGGIWKKMIVVNGQSPGPLIEANLGDQLVVHVTNKLSNATAIHWHGQYQNGTNFFDGTSAVTQCGIPPSQTLTYNFTVQNVGTYWWHGHLETQYTDGLFGGLVLHSPNETASFQQGNISTTTNDPAYAGEVLMLMGDLYNTLSTELLWRYNLDGTGMDGQPGDEPTPDAGQLNGVSQGSCFYLPPTDLVLPERRRSLNSNGATLSPLSARNPGDETTFTQYPGNHTCNDNFTSTYWNNTLEGGKTYRFRLVNTGSFADVSFSIDNHTLTVVEADGVSVEPVEVLSLTMGVAQRYSVLVTLNQQPGSYWMRSTLAMDAFTYDNPSLDPLTLGVLYYNGTNSSSLPIYVDSVSVAGVKDSLDTSFGGDLIPSDKLVVPDATKHVEVDFSMQYLADGRHRSFFNNTSWEPLAAGQNSLFAFAADALASPAQTYNDASQLIVLTQGIEVMDLVINSLDDGTHPFHLHGHTFWIVEEGEGSYTGTALNTTNAMRRDTIVIPAYSYVVLRFVTDNVGMWALHCHISWHMESGLLMQFANVPSTASLQKLIDDVPQEMHDHCSLLSQATTTSDAVSESTRRMPRRNLGRVRRS
ncbi:multicopper oxidase-domain-containing protein [Mrakia frigida]|uniref:multicopper oxidase-domain-containing protein n=1 Tax=Mrakia frigida TaxID=29902 RepID=UPI003FCBF601